MPTLRRSVPGLTRTYPRGSTANRTLGTTLAKGMVRCCFSQVESCRRGDASSRIHQGTTSFQERVLPAKRKKLYPVLSLPTWSPIAFQDSVEGVTTPAHASGTVVTTPLQCPLPWLGDGDPVAIWQPAARFVPNTDLSKLDKYG